MINLQVTVRIDVEPAADKSPAQARHHATSVGRMSLTDGPVRAGGDGR